MINIPKKICNKINCSKLIDHKEKFCDEHKHLINESRNDYGKYRYQRDKRYAKFYTSTIWRQTRKSALTRDKWLCQYCLANGQLHKAEVVDHFIPVKYDYELRLNMDNLVSSCIRHNTLKESDEKLLKENRMSLDAFKNKWRIANNKIKTIT